MLSVTIVQARSDADRLGALIVLLESADSSTTVGG